MKSLLLLIVLCVFSFELIACPCGCGAQGPLVMSPGESYKFLVGMSRMLTRNRVDSEGRLGLDDGPEGTDKMLFGFAQSLTDHLSLSGQGSVERNFHQESGDDIALSDPSFGIRYTLPLPAISSRVMSSSQIYGFYKPSLSKGLLEDADKEHQLDIHGNSLSEFGPGLDVWLSHYNLAVGVGYAAAFSRTALIESPLGTQLYEKNISHKSSISASYTWYGQGQVLMTLEREAKGQDRLGDSKTLVGSDSIRHSLSLSANIKTGFRKTTSFTYQNTGRLFTNKETPLSETLTVTYLVIV